MVEALKKVQREKDLSFKQQEEFGADFNAMKNLKERGFKLLENNRIENKTFNTILAKENEFKKKLNEMSQFYGKEISDLKNKLEESNILIEKYKENKAYLQENLKRTLMRGVVAMNLEAMNILEPESEKINNNNIVLNMANNMVDLNYFNKNNLNENNFPENNNFSNFKNNVEKNEIIYQNNNNNNNNFENNNISSNNSNSNIFQPEILEKKVKKFF